jgi:hypothetical protein
VRVLHDGELPAGPFAIEWDGRDDGGHVAARGVYLYVVRTPDGARSGRLVRIR